MASFLREKGFQAWALKGGFQGWRDAGYPVESKRAEVSTRLDDICPDCGATIRDHIGGAASGR